MTREQRFLQLLDAIGAFQRRHSGRTLGDHLLGTYTMLLDAGCKPDVCLAGALHSIYGTDVYKVRSVPFSSRQSLQNLFGARAETLAYTFGHMAPRTRLIEAGDVAEDMRADLRLIEAANILEQGGSLAKWPNIAAAWEQQKER